MLRVLVPRRPVAGLSCRQLEVLGLVVAGQQNKQIARNLGLSEHTINNRMSEIRQKLAARSRSHVAFLALARRLVVLAPQEN